MTNSPTDTSAQGAPAGGRRKSPEKRAAILAAAGTAFLAHGFRATSMDGVAARAGVSKQTVYSHFPGKDALFQACVASRTDSHGFHETTPPPAGDARTVLFLLAKRFMALLLDPEMVALHRVVQAETVGHPRVAELFFESGPGAIQRAVAQVLEGLRARGDLAIDDLEYAAWLLPNMAFGRFRTQLEFGIIDHVPAQQLDAHLLRVVDDFLALFEREAG